MACIVAAPFELGGCAVAVSHWTGQPLAHRHLLPVCGVHHPLVPTVFRGWPAPVIPGEKGRCRCAGWPLCGPHRRSRRSRCSCGIPLSRPTTTTTTTTNTRWSRRTTVPRPQPSHPPMCLPPTRPPMRASKRPPTQAQPLWVGLVPHTHRCPLTYHPPLGPHTTTTARLSLRPSSSASMVLATSILPVSQEGKPAAQDEAGSAPGSPSRHASGSKMSWRAKLNAKLGKASAVDVRVLKIRPCPTFSANSL